MKERIMEFLRAENKSSSQFADEIGVQPSGISHILSGRNNPSLDFVIKMLERYKYISADWLLFGKGTMYKDNDGMPTLFDQDFAIRPALEQTAKPSERTPGYEKITSSISKDQERSEREVESDMNEINGRIVKRESPVEKIVWFYSDGSFEEYFPR